MRWLVVCLAMTCANVWAKEFIVYPQPEAPDDRRGEYAVKLLQLALNEAGSTKELKPASTRMMQDRTFAELKRGGQIDVMWTMTTPQREADALPIRIPIYKGLIGWRVPLVHVEHSDMLAQVTNLTQLSNLTAGQASDWPDADILRANGLPVSTTALYSNLFQMLGKQRFDYMPRSVVEVWQEAENHRSDGLIVDQHIVLHYPAAVYFFVNKNNKGLADTISTGLEKAIANGKFNRLFYSYHARFIEQARLSQRVVIELHNPLLPKETPMNRKELWLTFPSVKSTRPDR